MLEALSPTTDWIVLTSALWPAPFYFYVSYAMIQYLFHLDRVTPTSCTRPTPHSPSPGRPTTTG
ncbi:MAG: hypothetical protein H0X12_14900, partial [Nocardioides sp.]|nr:hypothetical protein [Nocardioides sp.]